MEYTLKTSSICYKEDIIKEMSLEMNIPEKELNEIIDLNIKYIKKSVTEKDLLLISLPNLCKLRLNYKLALGLSASNSGNSPNVQSIRSKILLLKSYRKEKDIHRLMFFKNPLYERLWRKFKRIKYNKNAYKQMYSMINELEEKTNEIIKEIE